MGIWNVNLFCNDTTCDIKDTYLKFLEQQLTIDDAYQKTFKEYHEIMGTDEEAFFWYAISDTQWNLGHLKPSVKKKALSFIEKKHNTSVFEDSKLEEQWNKTLQKLKIKLESPMPPEKKVRKPLAFTQNPWSVGDLYAYQFHSEIAKERKLFGKYVLFHKIGNVEYYKDTIFSVIQVYNRCFDLLPNVDDVNHLSILPLVKPTKFIDSSKKIPELTPSYEWYTKATMIYEKKNQYPKKYFSFIGNSIVPVKSYEANDFCDFFLEKDSMDDWLSEYLLYWQRMED